MTSKTIRRMTIIGLAALALSGCCFLHLFWRQGTRPLTYYIHSAVPSHWVAEINAAHNTWNQTWNMFTYGGRGGGGTYAQDGVNSVFMTSFADYRILAAVAWNPFSCLLSDTDMGWNAARSDFTTSGSGIDVQSVALHEFGHYGVLLHVICPSNAVMQPTISLGSVKRSPTGCDAFGMFVSNILNPCYSAMGICFPSFFLFALQGFDSLDQEDAGTVHPIQDHNDELIEIWQGDSALRADSDSLGEFYANLALDYENGHSPPWSEYLTQERYDQIDSRIIGAVYASASTALRVDLDELRLHLRSKIGLSFGQIFGGDFNQYPGNPGEPLEPEPSSTCKLCSEGPSECPGCSES